MGDRPRPGEYAGGELWGVRWNERGQPPRIQECTDEQTARRLHDHLTRRQAGRPDMPQLLMAQITWTEQTPE